MQLFGIRLVGITAANGHKLVLTIVFVVAVVLGGRILRVLTGAVLNSDRFKRAAFWTGQAIRLITTLLVVVGFASIWFDNPARLTSALGLISAGVAFALQRVITAIAAYFILLRGNTFNVGERITMGGVRGDVIALSLIQTTIMEMGEPPGEQGDAPSMWVHSRQYTGRVVTVTNDRIFDQPVYNYSREFPFIWDEMRIPVAYRDDRNRVEQILLDVAARHTHEISEEAQRHFERIRERYSIRSSDMEPRVFWRITDNWVELTVRFIAHEWGVRDLKDRMSREILQLMDAAQIGIASGTYEIVGIPPIRIDDARKHS